MKKAIVFIFCISFSINLIAQNSITSDPNGQEAILEVKGFSQNAFSGYRSTAVFNTGSVSVSDVVRAVSSTALNSTSRNVGIAGYGSGSGTSINIGVEGNVTSTGSGSSYGGRFTVFSTSSSPKYGVFSEVLNTVNSFTSSSYGIRTNVYTNSTEENYGVYGNAENLGEGNATGGYFTTSNALSTSGIRTGVKADSYGNIGTKYGIFATAAGGGTNTGLFVEVSQGTINNAAVLKTNSNLNSFQLILDENDNDYSRIAFRNNNGVGWHQAVYRGATPINSQFNFYHVSTATDVLSLRGDGNAILAGTLTQSSDLRLKKNIKPITNSIAKISQLNGVYFDWNDQNRALSHQIGFIAQEVEKVLPELVQTDEKGFKSVAYANISAVLVEALKEQNNRIENLERELAQIKALLNKPNPTAEKTTK
ncbi:MAG: tail fiber domain-containing protein [Spirosomataceae bacterium]